MDDRTKLSYRLILSCFSLLGLLLAANFFGASPALAQDASANADEPLVKIPQKAQPIMPISEVRIGMKGYGMTVFKGTTIEPFPVEVLSIIPDSEPKRGTIWIKCDDPRLVQSGPVQGMSGSPIYLWDEGEEQTLGKGGRLIGAFAYGYSEVKYCLAGVQPIELMRDVATRVDEKELEEKSVSTTAHASAVTSGLRTLSMLQSMADANRVHDNARINLDTVSDLMQSISPNYQYASNTLPAGPHGVGRASQMLLPLSIGSQNTADFFTPILTPMGIIPTATPSAGLLGGAPPVSIKPEDAIIQPGSTLGVTLLSGDSTLAMTGTTTDVLPDGSVLGFGHTMNSPGPILLPMSTGYVHFVVPRLSISFKQASALQIAGTIGRDENSGIAGIEPRLYQFSPVDVTVKMTGQPERKYHYQVADNPSFTPVMTMVSMIQSIIAVQGVPPENTMFANINMTFSGGRDLHTKLMIPGAAETSIVFGVMPLINAMMQNPFEQLKLESVTADFEIKDEILAGNIISANIDHAVVAPGEDITINFQLRPYSQLPKSYYAKLKIPIDTPEGSYQVMITNPRSYVNKKLSSRPHLKRINTIDELYETIQQTLQVQNNAAYIVMNLADKGIAIGREEFPNLPSSRRALIVNKTNTYATPYREFVETKVTTDVVPAGEFRFTVKVQKKDDED